MARSGQPGYRLAITLSAGVLRFEARNITDPQAFSAPASLASDALVDEIEHVVHHTAESWGAGLQRPHMSQTAALS